jgi:hypothetical protein
MFFRHNMQVLTKIGNFRMPQEVLDPFLPVLWIIGFDANADPDLDFLSQYKFSSGSGSRESNQCGFIRILVRI